MMVVMPWPYRPEVPSLSMLCLQGPPEKMPSARPTWTLCASKGCGGGRGGRQGSDKGLGIGSMVPGFRGKSKGGGQVLPLNPEPPTPAPTLGSPSHHTPPPSWSPLYVLLLLMMIAGIGQSTQGYRLTQKTSDTVFLDGLGVTPILFTTLTSARPLCTKSSSWRTQMFRVTSDASKSSSPTMSVRSTKTEIASPVHACK